MCYPWANRRLCVQDANSVGKHSLGIAYNAIPSQQGQDAFKSWAKKACPDLWAKLEKRKSRRDANGLVTYHIDRQLRA